MKDSTELPSCPTKKLSHQSTSSETPTYENSTDCITLPNVKNVEVGEKSATFLNKRGRATKPKTKKKTRAKNVLPAKILKNNKLLKERRTSRRSVSSSPKKEVVRKCTEISPSRTPYSSPARSSSNTFSTKKKNVKNDSTRKNRKSCSISPVLKSHRKNLSSVRTKSSVEISKDDKSVNSGSTNPKRPTTIGSKTNFSPYRKRSVSNTSSVSPNRKLPISNTSPNRKPSTSISRNVSPNRRGCASNSLSNRKLFMSNSSPDEKLSTSSSLPDQKLSTNSSPPHQKLSNNSSPDRKDPENVSSNCSTLKRSTEVSSVTKNRFSASIESVLNSIANGTFDLSRYMSSKPCFKSKNNLNVTENTSNVLRVKARGRPKGSKNKFKREWKDAPKRKYTKKKVKVEKEFKIEKNKAVESESNKSIESEVGLDVKCEIKKEVKSEVESEDESKFEAIRKKLFPKIASVEKISEVKTSSESKIKKKVEKENKIKNSKELRNLKWSLNGKPRKIFGKIRARRKSRLSLSKSGESLSTGKLRSEKPNVKKRSASKERKDKKSKISIGTKEKNKNGDRQITSNSKQTVRNSNSRMKRKLDYNESDSDVDEPKPEAKTQKIIPKKFKNEPNLKPTNKTTLKSKEETKKSKNKSTLKPKRNNSLKSKKECSPKSKSEIEQFPKRTARMASLNAMARMACINEDSKPYNPTPKATSMALVVRPSTTVSTVFSDIDISTESDSEREMESPPPVTRRNKKRKNTSLSEPKTKLKRNKNESDSSIKNKKTPKTVVKTKRKRRSGEVDALMDMRDMVFTKRMASLNASAIMMATYSEPKMKKFDGMVSKEVGFKRKVSYKATKNESEVSFKAIKNESSKTRSVITVQKTTKKVKKSPGLRETKFEHQIIVKKKVKRSNPSTDTVSNNFEISDSDQELLSKTSGSQSNMIMDIESSLSIESPSECAPQTVTVSGMSEISVSSTVDGVTKKKVVKQVQHKSVTSSVEESPKQTAESVLSSSADQICVAGNSMKNSTVTNSYTPLGALEVMQPIMYHPQHVPTPHFFPFNQHVQAHAHAPRPIFHHPQYIHQPLHPSYNVIHPHPIPEAYPLAPRSPPYPPPPHPVSNSTSVCTSLHNHIPIQSKPSPAHSTTQPSIKSAPISSNQSSSLKSASISSSQSSSMKSASISSSRSSPSKSAQPPTVGTKNPVENEAKIPVSNAAVSERHHSAFSALSPSSNPLSPQVQGYQPVSGPIPSPGSAYSSPPKGSPGTAPLHKQGYQPVSGPIPSPGSAYSSPPKISPGSAPFPASLNPQSPPQGSKNLAFGNRGPQPYPPPLYPYENFYPRTPHYMYQPIFHPSTSYANTPQPPAGAPPGNPIYNPHGNYTYTVCVPGPQGPPNQQSSMSLALSRPPGPYPCGEAPPQFFTYSPQGNSQGICYPDPVKSGLTGLPPVYSTSNGAGFQKTDVDRSKLPGCNIKNNTKDAQSLASSKSSYVRTLNNNPPQTNAVNLKVNSSTINNLAVSSTNGVLPSQYRTIAPASSLKTQSIPNSSYSNVNLPSVPQITQNQPLLNNKAPLTGQSSRDPDRTASDVPNISRRNVNPVHPWIVNSNSINHQSKQPPKRSLTTNFVPNFSSSTAQAKSLNNIINPNNRREGNNLVVESSPRKPVTVISNPIQQRTVTEPKNLSTSSQKNSNDGAVSAPNSKALARHLLCQSFPLSRSKTNSVLAKVKPINQSNSSTPNKSTDSEDESPECQNKESVTPENLGKETLKPENNSVNLSVPPRKRGRPFKKKEGIGSDTINNSSELNSSDSLPSENFCHAPDDKIEEKTRKVSLLKSSGASIRNNKNKNVKNDNEIGKSDSKSSINIQIENNSTIKIKSEGVSPKSLKYRGKHLNNERSASPYCKIKQEAEILFRGFVPISSENKIDTQISPKKFRTVRISHKNASKNAADSAKERRRKSASLLAYLKRKNDELDDDSLEKISDIPQVSNKKSPKAEKSPFESAKIPQVLRKRRSSSNASKLNKAPKKPKHCHNWSWEEPSHEAKVWLTNDEEYNVRKCYKAIKHKQGDVINVRDCVLLRSGPKKNDQPFVAKIAAMWEDPDTADMMMSLLWYYRPEHTEAGRRSEDLVDEVFASKHRDHLSVACIEDRCYVLTLNEYCRYRRLLRSHQERINPSTSPVPENGDLYLRRDRQPPGCVVQDLLFLCRKVYDYRQRRILKNPC